MERRSLEERVRLIVERLLEWYRDEPWWRREKAEPLRVMLSILLSNRSNRRVVRRVVAELLERYPRLEDMLGDPDGVRKALQPLGLAALRARAVLGLARLLAETGGVESFLGLPAEEARRRLLTIPGVGEKTADVLLMALWDADVFPVDTHIARIASRLGLVEPGARPEQVRRLLEPLIPRGLRARAHLAMIQLGREVCRPRRPRCSECPLRGLCSFPRGTEAG
ncbi:endonuclease III [Pyrodictium abyssi]|uniref:endonuclease III domain-containing protein n=1 Tax=Pyrodictium abyssi TaxID=54256 RepID=UPI0030C71092